MKGRIWAALLAVYIFWGSTYLGIRIGLETIPPFMLAGARFLTAGRGLAPLSEISPNNMRHAAYAVTTEAGARANVRELASRGVTLIKTWVDDRGGTGAPGLQQFHRADGVSPARVQQPGVRGLRNVREDVTQRDRPLDPLVGPPHEPVVGLGPLRIGALDFLLVLVRQGDLALTPFLECPILKPKGGRHAKGTAPRRPGCAPAGDAPQRWIVHGR